MSESTSFLRVLRRPLATVASVESAALLVGAVVFVLGGAVSLLVAWGHDLPISGRGSLGAIVAIGGAVVAAAVFVLARVLMRVFDERTQGRVSGAKLDLHWLDVAALAFAVAIIALLGWLGIADVVERSFADAVVFTFPAAVLAGVAMAVTAYVAFLSAVNLTPMLLSLVLAVFLVVGVFASMLSASDPHWWQENLSALGMTDDISALAFNLTLIVAGAIVTTIAHAATANLSADTHSERRGRSLVRWALVVIGVFLACVGVFPVDRFFAVHNTVASGMAAVFAALVIGLRWFIPAMPRVFVTLGYVFLAVIVVLGVFFAVGYYNLTAVELVAAILIFTWIILFLRNTGAAEQQAAPAA